LDQEIEVTIKGGEKSGDESYRGAGIPTIFDNVRLPKEEREKLPYGNNWWWHTAQDTIDKADVNGQGTMQVKVYLAEVLNLCNSTVYPFEFVNTSNIIINELKDLQIKGKGSLSLDTLIRMAEELKDKASKLNKKAKTITSKKEA